MANINSVVRISGVQVDEHVLTSSIISETMTVWELKKWIQNNLNCKNMLIYNNLSAESVLYMTGSISDGLFQGAKYYMYTYCETIEKKDAVLGRRKIEYLRTYITLFRRLFRDIVRKIQFDLNINVADCIHVNRTERNLTIMIDLMSISNYEGDGDFGKIKSMQKAFITEYRTLKPSFNGSSIRVVRESFMVLAVTQLYELADLLWSPHS